MRVDVCLCLPVRKSGESTPPRLSDQNVSRCGGKERGIEGCTKNPKKNYKTENSKKGTSYSICEFGQEGLLFRFVNFVIPFSPLDTPLKMTRDWLIGGRRKLQFQQRSVLSLMNNSCCISCLVCNRFKLCTTHSCTLSCSWITLYLMTRLLFKGNWPLQEGLIYISAIRTGYNWDDLISRTCWLLFC